MLARRPAPLTPLEEEVLDLRDRVADQAERIAELEEAVRQRDEAFAPAIMFPAAMRLTEHEAVVLAALWTSRTPCVRRAALATRLWPDAPETDPHGVDVLVCRMRRKLEPFTITVATLFQQGYALTRAGREKLGAILDVTAIDPNADPRPKRRTATPWVWTKPQDDILRAGYARGATNAQISAEMKARGHIARGASSLVQRAKALGIVRSKPHLRWSDEEDAIVRAGTDQGKLLGAISLDLRQAGFARGAKAVGAYKVRMGYAQPRNDFWSTAETAIIADGVRKRMTDRAIAAALRAAGYARNEPGVVAWRRKQNLMKDRPRWEARHDAELRDLCTAGVRQLEAARRMGFHLSCVALHGRELGLRWSNAVAWDEADVTKLHDCAARALTVAEAAREIGRPFNRVSAKAHVLGLRFRLDYGAEAKRRPAVSGTRAAA